MSNEQKLITGPAVRLIFYLLCTSSLSAQLKINEIMPANASWKYDPVYFNYSSWLELYNDDANPINIGGFYLTDDKNIPKRWQIPAGTVIAAKGFLVFWADETNTGLHTSFKLNSDGEFAAISNASGQFIDSLSYSKQHFNTSYGRYPDGTAAWYLYSSPTFGTTNAAQGVLKISADPVFSATGGFFTTPFKICLNHSSAAAKIYFTLDGSEPDETSALYIDSIRIDTTVAIRARAYDTSAVPGKIISQTYFINVNKTLPVVSISVDPEFMWDDSIGIYVTGVNGVAGPYSEPASNFYRDWERAANIELFDAGGMQVANDGIGIQIQGNYTRAQPEKSFDIHYNIKYGSKKLKYRLFKSKPGINDFYSFYLRNSGNDWKYTAAKWRGTMFKDALAQTLAIGQMDVDYQAYQPAVVYINGQYFGILNFREKLNDDYIKGNYPAINSNDVDIIKQIQVDPWHAVAGDTIRYNQFLLYLTNHDMAQAANYNYAKTQMDIREFINYHIIETYACNTDWPQNNQKMWSPRDGSGKWRWMLNDFDAGMASSLLSPPDLDMMLSAFNSFPTWGSCVIDNLFNNINFKNEYIQTYAAHLNTTFAPARVNFIIDSLKNNIAAEMPNQISRWGTQSMAIPSISQWNTDVALTKDFATRRPAYAWQHLKSKVLKFNMADVSLTIDPPGEGTVYIHGATVNGSSLTGPFFKGIPIEFVVKPNTSQPFVKWEITNNGIKYDRYSSLLTDTIEGTYVIIAHFTGGSENKINTAGCFTAYPNPVNNYLTIENLEFSGFMDYTITDVNGSLAAKNTIRFNQQLLLPLSNLKPGVYLLKLTTEKNTEVIKIIKE